MESTAPVQSVVPHVDRHLIRFGQGGVVVLTGLAFVLQAPALVVVAAAALLIAAALPAAGPFRLLYRGVVVSMGLLRPRIVEDDPAPHRFAQSVGATFLVASSLVLLLTNAAVIGWALDLIVFVLAGVNL